MLSPKYEPVFKVSTLIGILTNVFSKSKICIHNNFACYLKTCGIKTSKSGKFCSRGKLFFWQTITM